MKTTRSETVSKFSKVQDAIRKCKKVGVVKVLNSQRYVGKLGGVQELSLGNGCADRAIASHELGHALGKLHMMKN